MTITMYKADANLGIIQRVELIHVTDEFAVYHNNRKPLPPCTMRRELLIGRDHRYFENDQAAIAWLGDELDKRMDRAIQQVDAIRVLRSRLLG